MPTKITMPALSPTMEEGTLAKWLKKEGDTVEAGDVIAEIETDKATMEFEAVDEGTIGKILVEEGTEGVKVNQLIAILLEEGEDASAIDAFLNKQETATQAREGGKEQKAAAPAPIGPTAATTGAPAQTGKEGERIFASPLAKRIARKMGIDLRTVQGTGPRGRIVKADLEKGGKLAGQKTVQPTMAATAIQAPAGPDARQLSDMLGMEYEAIPNSQFRKTVAKRLLESKQTVPHFYLSVEFRIDNLIAARKDINDKANGAYKLSVNDFVIKACANALQEYPAANTAWTEQAILQYRHADISVAVATPNGLITPVVRKAETKGLRQISEEVKDLAVRAREGKLKPEEYQGGSFTISNLGMYGIKNFGAIINPPQSCILAVGTGEQKPYVAGNEIKIGTFMECTLSVDHRSVDGAVGAEFLQVLKRYVENPVSMLV